jgi:hypothetical protein
VLNKMAAIQMLDVHLPTTDGGTVILSRYTEPEPIRRCCYSTQDQLARPAAAQN